MPALTDFSYSFVLTNACNLRCSHCFLGDKRNTKSILDINDINLLTNKAMSESRMPTFNWGGGEPLILGKKYMSDLVSLKCFDSQNVRNTIYSTFHIDMDKDWREILNRFDSVTFSIDSYRTQIKSYNLKKAICNLSHINAEKVISYTPSQGDTDKTIEHFYFIARDIGASVFHVGFLYNDYNLLHPDIYIRAINKVFDLQSKYKSPVCGFHKDTDNIYHSIGWRAYDCFTKGAYICEGIITPCYILYSKGYKVPSVTVRDYLEGRVDIKTISKDFVNSFFFNRPTKCTDCEYYVLCMGGCPYFLWKSGGNIDIYCDVYRLIFGKIIRQG
jgi:radical SAM protein with 4Fe4S-binding SPASM domain